MDWEELLYKLQSAKCKYQIEAWDLNAQNMSFLIMATIHFCAVPTSADGLFHRRGHFHLKLRPLWSKN